MKSFPFKVAAVLIFMVHAAAAVQGQEPFFPSKAGIVLQYEDRDASGKLLSSTTDSLSTFSGDFTKGYAIMASTESNQDGKTTAPTGIQFRFVDGEVITDITATMEESLKEMVAQSLAASGASEEDMKEMGAVLDQTTVSGECRGIPADISEGMELPEYSAEVKLMFVKVKVSSKDRKVSGRETVTVPAGTFDCFVVEEQMTVKSMFMSEKSSMKTWYARGIGVVKEETWDKKKLVSVSELTAIRGGE